MPKRKRATDDSESKKPKAEKEERTEEKEEKNENMLRILSFNVASLNAACKKGFVESMKKIDADIICLQGIGIKKLSISINLDTKNTFKFVVCEKTMLQVIYSR